MKGPYEDPNAELHQELIGILQEVYPVLGNKDLATLCFALGIKPSDAFPWHSDKAASDTTTQIAA